MQELYQNDWSGPVVDWFGLLPVVPGYEQKKTGLRRSGQVLALLL
jgi:hypothetical protein